MYYLERDHVDSVRQFLLHYGRFFDDMFGYLECIWRNAGRILEAFNKLNCSIKIKYVIHGDEIVFQDILIRKGGLYRDVPDTT